MANIARFRVERKDGPDALKFMLRTLKREFKGWIEREYKAHQAHETKSQKKRRRKRQNWIKRQKDEKLQLYLKTHAIQSATGREQV